MFGPNMNQVSIPNPIHVSREQRQRGQFCRTPLWRQRPFSETGLNRYLGGNLQRILTLVFKESLECNFSIFIMLDGTNALKIRWRNTEIFPLLKARYPTNILAHSSICTEMGWKQSKDCLYEAELNLLQQLGILWIESPEFHTTGYCEKRWFWPGKFSKQVF